MTGQAVSPALLGRRSDPIDLEWDRDDSILYALGVGAGQDGGDDELELTTENSSGRPLRALPTLASALCLRESSLRIDLGAIDRSALVHGSQELTLHQPLPPQGRLHATAEIVELHDTPAGALIVTEHTGTTPTSGPVFTSRMSALLRGGSCGVPAPPRRRPEAPEGPPDLTVTMPTRPDQALVYRLSGDRNPLHSDPEFARAAGFPRPILHGMCTYGITARALLRALGGTPESLAMIAARFKRPVFPGDVLTLSAWRAGHEEIRFEVSDDQGRVVLDRGELHYRP